MRVRLTDGTRHIDIHAPSATLADIEATTLRLLTALPPPDSTPPTEDTPRDPFGFTLDGTSLGADADRADTDHPAELQHPDPHRDDEDEDDDQ
jgi:hypothetical protein